MMNNTEKKNYTGIENNVSYVLIPFKYNSSQGINKSIVDKKTPFCIDNKLFYGFVNALIENVFTYKFDIKDEKTSEIKLVCFDTGIGFLIVKYLELNDTNEGIDKVNILATTIENVKNEIESHSYNLLTKVKEEINKLQLLVDFEEFNNIVLTYNLVIDNRSGKENNMLLSVNFDREDEIGKNDDIPRNYYCSSNQLSILTNYKYENFFDKENTDEITVKNKNKEEEFRKNYEDAMLVMFLLLQHERIVYLMFCEEIITKQSNKYENLSGLKFWDKIVAKKNHKTSIKEIKNKILKFLSCYSYSRITEDVELHNIYIGFREILDLSNYENNLNDLVFRLNEELDKNSENKITYISFFITVLGIISIVLDVVEFFATFCGS